MNFTKRIVLEKIEKNSSKKGRPKLKEKRQDKENPSNP